MIQYLVTSPPFVKLGKFHEILTFVELIAVVTGSIQPGAIAVHS